MAICSGDVSGEDYADFIYRRSNLSEQDLYSDIGEECLDFVNREYVIIHYPLDSILPLTTAKYSYNSIPKLYALQDTTSMDESGITQAFNQPGLASDGSGTLIGLIDTGIDYQNSAFKNADGSTRILGIWDQTLIGDRPFRLNYGAYYSQETINQALNAEDPYSIVPSTDDSGHGTFMAGIAAGGSIPEEDFIGAAPQSGIAVVKLKNAKQYLRDFYLIQEDALAFQENDIMMGIHFLTRLAEQLFMPVVIYIGLGTNQGSHDGSSPLGLTLRNLSTYLGTAVSLPAGNETGYRHHYLGQFSLEQEYVDVELRVGPNERGFSLELWAREPELYSVAYVSPSGEVKGRIPISHEQEVQSTFLLENTVIYTTYRTAEIGSGSQLIFMRFQDPVPGIWRIRVFNSLFISGIFHMWLPVYGFISDNTYFLNSNPDTLITDPGNVSSSMTAGAYDHTTNSIYIHSSRGFTRFGGIKPELAAPGVNVYGPGLNNTMIRRTGTSVAAAHVAGAIADLFSWGIVQGNNPSMSDVTIKAYLIRGAKRNPMLTYPNREFGYGALDLYQSFLSLRES